MTRTTKATKGTAGEAYEERRVEVDRLVIDLRAALGKHAQRQRHDGRNWGWVGDLGHAAETLKELVRFVRSSEQG